VKIPAKNSFAEGAMLEPVNTVLKAVRRLSLLRGDVVLVAGQGPIGLMFTRLLQLAGVQVIATDLLEPRLRLARKFGAKWTSFAQTGRAELPLRPDARQRVLTATLIHRATRGRGLDAAVVAVPSDAAVQQALQLIRCGGQLMLFAHTKRFAPEGGNQRPLAINSRFIGVYRSSHFSLQSRKTGSRPAGPAFSLDLASVCLDEKDLLGSYSSDFTLQDEVARLVFSRRLDVRQLISHRFPLEQTAAAVQLAGRPTEDSLKIIVTS
jgi:L-iditol 2-dehydrogenase